MMRPYFSSVVVTILSLAAVACSSTIDVGQNNGDSGAASDGAKSDGFDDGDSGSDGGGHADATTSTSKTQSGVSCASADLPPAASACSIPGSYTVTDSLCSSTDPTCMDPGAMPDFVWTADVTLVGTKVTLTNGTNRLLHCTLTPPCTCVGSGGDVFNFTATGFANLAGAQCQGTATQGDLSIGVKQ